MEESINFITKKEIETESSSPTTEKELSYEEIINSNNVELIAKYAKENRNRDAIEKVRELLELSRKTGEVIVQDFINSFKECETKGKEYSDFENTESGKKALDALEKMPEPFKSLANKKLEDYKKELKYNTELFKKHKNNSEEIWKEVFGFEYYNIPEFKERFKTFLFKDIKGLSKEYFKNNFLEAKQDPFAINFFVEDPKNFNRVYGVGTKNASVNFGGFSSKKEKTHVNLINMTEKVNPRNASNTVIHESEHAIHSKTDPFYSQKIFHAPDISDDSFNKNKNIINNEVRFFYMHSLENAKDEIFAFQKGNRLKEGTEKILSFKINTPLFKEREKGILDEIREPNPYYDYNEELREKNYKWLEQNETLLETEKKQLKDAIDFFQLEYERVLKNMIDLIYGKNQSVEFFRNVPINELWKYSNGKYNRTDFIIKEFKF